MNEKLKRGLILKSLPYLLIALGFGGWFGGPLVSWAGRHVISDSIPLPWSMPESVAVDAKGRIYVGLNHYDRVQVYDADGNFLRAWFLAPEPGHSGRYRLRVGEDQNLEAVAPGFMHRYSPDGDHLEWRAAANSIHDSLGSQCTAIDPVSGRTVRYEIRGLAGRMVGLFPHVVKVDAADGERTLASTPWFFWPLQAVFPAFGWALLGALMLWWRRHRPRQLA